MTRKTSAKRVWLAGIGFAVAGSLLLLETLLGIFYVMGIGFGSLREILMDFCLTMAFPIFLIGLASLRKASIALWIFFLAQWVNSGILSSHSPLHLTNPLAWFHGEATFIGSVLVTVSTQCVSKARKAENMTTLQSVLLEL